MNDIILELGKFSLIFFTLDGATNVQGKEVIFQLSCGPRPFFIELLSMELSRESTDNLLKKNAILQAADSRIDLRVGS